ncbi:MAG: methyltransferase domain-containing protein [Calditrichaeota bacterium]|nr:methyltransferase domain-containing protein [Calditrichota bacterium]
MDSIPYSQLARIYDKVMAHVNYKMWAEYVRNLFQFADIPIQTLVDLSCGTGKHIAFMAKSKLKVAGCDLSKEMLKRAAQKSALKKVPFFVNDAVTIALKRDSFDAAVMLYDSINYIFDDKDVLHLLDEISRILKPGGIFIFDIVTKAGLKRTFDNYYESDSWNGLAYQRRSWFNSKEQTQHNEFYLLFNGNSFREEHIQFIRPGEEWKRLIKKSGMNLIQEFSNFTFLPVDQKSERIHFVCRKEIQ